jgi:glycine cleavage system aminomethyltransferase T
MPIQATTKATLTAFAEEQGFAILDSAATQNNQCWSLACNNAEREHDPFSIRIDALNNTNVKPAESSVQAASSTQKLKNLCKSNVMLHVTHEDNFLVECNDCHLLRTSTTTLLSLISLLLQAPHT